MVISLNYWKNNVDKETGKPHHKFIEKPVNDTQVITYDSESNTLI